jgi:hypothetical protein
MIKEEQKTKLGDLEKKIKIGYQDVSVERDTTTFQKQSDAYGEYDHRKNTISIQNGLSPLDEANTLLHEILHGVAYINSLTQTGEPLDEGNKEEMVINTMTNGLSQVFRDNKWLLPYFIKKFKG